MVGPWVNSGQRKSVGFFQRIRSHHLGKKRFVLPFSKTDLLNSMDRSSDPIISSQFSTSASTWRPQKFDGLERLWDQNSNEPQSDVNVEPLVIRNPVHSRKLEEPIERKREYWSENLLYIMRREGLIPKNRPVVMDRPTPEEPYRLSANVVRLLEQEPQLYLAKSNIKISSFDSEISDGIPSGSAGSWDQKPFPYSRAKYGAEEKAGSFEVSSNRPPHHCCECGREKSPKPLPTEGFGRKSLSFSSLSELRSRHPVHEQSRHYFSTAARKPAQPCLDDRV